MGGDIAKCGMPYRWKPGQSGNPAGPKPGSRKLFNEEFFRDLHETWAAMGKTAMQDTAKKAPATFLALAARLIPQQVAVDLQASTPGNLSPSECVRPENRLF